MPDGVNNKNNYIINTINTLILFLIIVIALVFADLLRKTYESFFYQKLGVPTGNFKWLLIMLIITGFIFILVLLFINKKYKKIDTQSIILGAL